MEDTEDEYFEISAVARLTGISPHALRVWERRYGVVQPNRSENQRRKYSQPDIQRLSLLKTLVDNGHSIGSVAELSMDQLSERVENVLASRADDENLENHAPAGVCRISVVGKLIRNAVREAADKAPALSIVGEFADLTALTESLKEGASDLLIIESETLFPEDVAAIREAIEQQGIRRAIVVYRFARDTVVKPLDIRKITALRAPVDASEIQLACIADVQLALRSGEKNHDAEAKDPKIGRPNTGNIPERAFSDDQLIRISDISSVVKCECPQHLASLLASLSAFESYSEQCEDRSPEDAKLHAYLHETTADCRSRMEAALSKVLVEEGIEV
ncbi:MAG: MerR family transcriptional regulator [Verrucomicrobiales bacterium]|nr:MerR family transcriptional regulator [Verrucomicrobiales bacterium]